MQRTQYTTRLRERQSWFDKEGWMAYNRVRIGKRSMQADVLGEYSVIALVTGFSFARARQDKGIYGEIQVQKSTR